MATGSYIAPSIPDEVLREAARLDAVDRLGLIDTPQEPTFDRVARLARDIFGTKIALVSLFDAHRQWFKACEGLSGSETNRRETFCRLTIETARPLVVPDAQLDPRFSGSPFVTGDPFVRFYAGVPLITSDGQPVGSLCAIDPVPREFETRELGILQDLAAVTVSLMELRARAGTDMVTGLLSRRALVEEGVRAFAVARRQRYDLSAIAIDIDRFKSVNDRFGHAAGDHVLAAVAEACATAVRETDLVGRVGGEEFVAIVHSGRAATLEVAERMRRAVEALHVSWKGEAIPVTASFGISAVTRSVTDFDDLLARADAALYEAKRAGRNRCVEARSGPEDSPLQRRVFKAGQIVFFNRMSTVDCTVRSLGPDGAGLDVSSTAGLPSEFSLAIRADGFERRCRVVGMSDRHLSVDFT